MRFMIPWIDDWRKLSDPDFITKRWMPTTFGHFEIICSAKKSLRVRFASTIAVISPV